MTSASTGSEEGSGASPATNSVTPKMVSARALSLYGRQARTWAADPTSAPVLDVGLKPPTEREVIGDVSAAMRWIHTWREAESALPVTVQWGTRQWARAGNHAVPERVRAVGAEAISAVAGHSREYALLRERCQILREALSPTAVNGAEDADSDLLSDSATNTESATLTSTIRSHANAVAAMSSPDFVLLADVVAWLASHPLSGKRIRELPIRGIDTKWIEKRRGMVEGLVCAVTGGQGLGVAGPPPRVRVRILDPQHRLAGLTDFAVRVDELTAVDLPMHTVIVTENLETFLALPEREGVVAIHGSGFAVDALTQLPWLADRRILYWGDLDSHGFAILNMARGRGLNVESVLMDADTLLAFRDLWVREPKSFTGVLSQLTATEAQTLSVLADEGYPRLEQERVPWDYALLALDTSLDTALGTSLDTALGTSLS